VSKINGEIGKLPRLICLSGIDGSGKTTAAEHIAGKLREAGYAVDILWLRYNHRISKPLLGFCRAVGLTRYTYSDGYRVGYHDFHRSQIVSWMFVWLQYIDALLVRYFVILPRIVRKNRVVVVDRYVYDILIDIVIDTHITRLGETRIGRAFKSLMPRDSVVILIDRACPTVCAARPQNRLDKTFACRYRLYKELSADPMVNTVSNDGPLQTLFDSLEQYLGLKR